MEEGVWVLFVYGVFVGASDEVIDGAPVATTVLGVDGALVTSFVFSSTVLLAPLHVRVENDCTCLCRAKELCHREKGRGCREDVDCPWRTHIHVTLTHTQT